MTLDELLQPARFQPLLLALYGPELMPAQLPVLVSQWSKYYFAMLWQAASAGQVPARFDAVTVELDARGLPVTFMAAQAPARLALLGQLPAAVLWGNAGDYLEQQLKDDPQARALLTSAHSPLFEAVRYEAEGRRRRRTCCLSYKVAWVGYCEHCPLLSGTDQAQ
ncbi:(2Fe-2S)-binding protein [Pseudomonas fontis]|uniref:(2Fe-2S)-binding protein n=1 Tax=Pseudomonas fontis TaxID=2942633 RepID=UPI00235F62BD|nr:(2Fe-2S)-binding protein [Pseudomonas fontis]MDD0976139.1 (2Fe-2S)-binding protein [Pseudomonas fontis]